MNPEEVEDEAGAVVRARGDEEDGGRLPGGFDAGLLELGRVGWGACWLALAEAMASAIRLFLWWGMEDRLPGPSTESLAGPLRLFCPTMPEGLCWGWGCWLWGWGW